MNETNKTPWHLDKKVSLSVIGLIIAQLCVSVAAWTTLTEQVRDHEKRISIRDNMRISERMSLLESAVIEQRSRDDRQDQERKEALGLIRDELKSINQKLDRKRAE